MNLQSSEKKTTFGRPSANWKHQYKTESMYYYITKLKSNKHLT